MGKLPPPRPTVMVLKIESDNVTIVVTGRLMFIVDPSSVILEVPIIPGAVNFTT